MTTMTAPEVRDARGALDVREALRARVDAAGDLTDWDLTALARDLVDRRREVDLMLARVAAEVAARSGQGASGLARRRGFRGSDQLVASLTGGTVAEAERLRVLGTALEGRVDDAPGGAAVLPHLAWAARERHLSPDAFVLLRGVLMRHPDACDGDGVPVADAVRATPLGRQPLARVERVAVDRAVALPLRSVRALVAQLEAGLTPARVAEENYEELRASRLASFREEANGMVFVSAMLDPLTAAPLMAAVDGYVAHALRARRDDGVGGQDAGDRPTAAQLRADALGWLGRHATGCRQPHDAVRTTVSIRVSLADLRAGDGYGTVDGITMPIPVGVLRRHAVDAEVVPTVLGMGSEILDHGRAKRLFTAAQRRAIAERDRGCAFCGAPPRFCDVHHLHEWQYGGLTNARDGIMLCVGCHHWIHRERWAIRWRRGSLEFVPPATVDPRRTPRQGYQARVRLDRVTAPRLDTLGVSRT